MSDLERSDIEREAGEEGDPIPASSEGPLEGEDPKPDPFRFLTTPDHMQGIDADFRREVEALARSMLTPDGKSLRERPLDVPSTPGVDWHIEHAGPGAEPRLGSDVEAGTPFLVTVAARALAGVLGRDLVRDSVLLAVAHREAETVRLLRRVLRVPASTLSSVISRLERDRLLQREVGIQDRRQVHLTLTTDGRREARERARRWRQADEDLLRRLLPWERDELRRLLAKAWPPGPGRRSPGSPRP